MIGYERLQAPDSNDVELHSAYPQLSPPPSSSAAHPDEGKRHFNENDTGLVYGQQPVASPALDSRLLPQAPVSFDGSSSSSLASSASIADPQPALAVNHAVVPPSAPAPAPVGAHPAGAPHQPQHPTQFVPIVPPVPTLAELEERIKTRQVEFETGKYLSDAWTFFRHNACSLLLVGLLWALIGLIFYVGINSIVHAAYPCYEYYEYCPNPRPRFALRMFLWLVASTMVFTPLVSCAFGAMFNALRTNSYVLVRHCFGSFRRPYYWRLLRLSFVMNILHALLSFLIIPGIWFSIATTFSLALHLEHNITSCKAIVLSIKLVHRHCCRMCIFLLILALMQVVGAFCFFVGLLVTVPIALFAIGYCYHHLVGVNGVAVLVARPVGVDYI